jgi:hypothetical protein
MIQINYPDNKIEFERKYRESLKISNEIKSAFDRFISAPHFIFPSFSLDYILTAPIEELYKKVEFLYMSKKDKEELKKIFQYDDFQSKIKAFFEQNLPLKTCYYCNLDFVNAFDDLFDYHDALDFVKKATVDDLRKIKGIDKTAPNILIQQSSISSIDDLIGINKTQKQNLKNILLEEKHSHFTLDHVVDKATHPLLALSLYNLVPSCYTCNSKFKVRKQFIDKNTAHFLSPTLGEGFNFNRDVKFRLLFRNGKNASYVNSSKDFVLDFKYFKNSSEYENYINTFKLKGRYVFHKDEIVNLIDKKKKYSDSKINEMAKLLKIPAQKVKEDLFGKELFHGGLEDKSMTKLKRDIAEQIGIKK